MIFFNFQCTDGKHRHTLTKKALQYYNKHKEELKALANNYDDKTKVNEDLLQVKPLQMGKKPLIITNDFVER